MLDCRMLRPPHHCKILRMCSCPNNCPATTFETFKTKQKDISSAHPRLLSAFVLVALKEKESFAHYSCAAQSSFCARFGCQRKKLCFRCLKHTSLDKITQS
ncbi:unnamed protein product [Ixodes pacificus]